MALAERLALSLDTTLLADRVGISLDDWQREVIHAPERYLALCCARQVGKTTTVELLAASEMLAGSDRLVLVSGPSRAHSQRLVEGTKQIILSVCSTHEIDHDTQLELTLSSGSRIVAIPGDSTSVRGWSAPSMVIVDEAGFVTAELLHALWPMTAVSGGRFVLLSSPSTKESEFYRLWTEASALRKWRITAHDCPRIPPEEIEQARRLLPPEQFAREYMAEWSDAEASVFNVDAIRRCFTGDYELLFPAGVLP